MPFLRTHSIFMENTVPGSFFHSAGFRMRRGSDFASKTMDFAVFSVPITKGYAQLPRGNFSKSGRFPLVLQHLGPLYESVCFAGMLFFVAFGHFRGVRFAADPGAPQLPDRKNGKQRGKLLLGTPGDTLSAQIPGGA